MDNTLGHIEVLQPGLACSIQDKGRFGYLSEGIPMAGAMDQNLFGLANLLVGNTEDKAVIEWKLIPPKLKFLSKTSFAVVGFGVQITLNGFSINAFKKNTAEKGDTLHIKRSSASGYGYLAVTGGIQTPKILGSHSFYPNITPNKVLEKGMLLPVVNLKNTDKNQGFSKLNIPNLDAKVNLLEVHKAPEFYMLPKKIQDQLFNKLFSINNQSNRMGFLFNESIINHSKSILSSPVLPGTVQWTPSGQLIVLMRDAQTVGGYPRILQLQEDAISILARVATNNFVRFSLI